MKSHLLLINLLFLFASCTSVPKEDEENIPKTSYQQEDNHVDVVVLKRAPFRKELVSNGKLKATRKSDLRFSVSGKLSPVVFIKNGQRVSQGQVLARLEEGEYKRSLQKSQTTLNIATLELEDYLLSRDISLKDSAKIPKADLEIAKIRSGYTVARQNLLESEFNYQNTILNAPFAGNVANVKTNAFEQVNASDVFCTLIDDAEFEVEFYLVESEIRDVNVNDRVRIIPNTMSTSFQGYVSQINPLVDEHGLIMVKAKTKNAAGTLMEGMNVKVFIEKEIANLLAVPKAAVVLRQNQEVIFKYSKGTAQWTYVHTNLENSHSYSISPSVEKGATLEPGDTIIISGNLNLAHESEVKITP